MGLLGGFIVIYLGAVGMLESFSSRPIITDVVEFSVVLIAIVYVATGYLAAKPAKDEIENRPRQTAPLAGVVAGALVGVFVIAMTLLAEAGYNPRDMFIAINPALLDILTFGQSIWLGLVIQIAFGALMGLIAGYLYTSAPNTRSVVVTTFSTVVLVALGAPLFTVMLDGMGIPDSWLFEREGLTVLGAIVVAAAAGWPQVVRAQDRRGPQGDAASTESHREETST